MQAIAYSPTRNITQPPVNSNIDVFTQTFDMVQGSFTLPFPQKPEKDCIFWSGLETVTQMAAFAARSHVGDPVHLWKCIRPLIESIQGILEDPRASKTFKRREIARLTKCYHQLTSAACVFSVAGDTLLRDVLCGEADDACGS